MNPLFRHRLVLLAMLVIGFASVTAIGAEVVLPGLVSNLVCRYDFDHPVAGNPALETDLGFSGTAIQLINGGAAMRTNDNAYFGSGMALQVQQVNPAANGNDDWKAGVYLTNGVASLGGFSSVAGITLMGWVKPTGTNPNLDSTTAATNDFYNAVGLFGVLSGNSEGHAVRALLEVIDVSGTLKLVALGRRIDGGSSLTLAATNDWQALLPGNVWSHLAASFDFDNGTMALYRNGVSLVANYTTTADVWGVGGGTEPDVTSVTKPTGIKIGGSFPQNTQERNAFNGRFDDLMFFNRVLSPMEVQAQFANFGPSLVVQATNGQITLNWPVSSPGFSLESRSNLSAGSWVTMVDVAITNGESQSVTLLATNAQQFFRLKSQ
ncbi:MAG: hypothetical protein RLY20_1954 [Verrucomicrobiota bacterium]|jgi:hypothetical protein